MSEEMRRFPGDMAENINADSEKAEALARLEILETNEANGSLTDEDHNELELIRSSLNMIE